MQMVELKQKRRFQSRYFKLYDDRIVVETKTLSKNQKYELKLDRIGDEILYESDSTLIGKIFLFVCLAFPPILWLMEINGIALTDAKEHSTVGIFFLCCYSLALFNYMKVHQDDIIIVGGQHRLAFYKGIPDETKALDFVNLVISYSKNYLKEKYTKFDSSVSAEIFLERLVWLKEKEILSEREFAALREEHNLRNLL